jgi:hypothetical protein
MPPFSSHELLNQSLEIDVCVSPSKSQPQDLGPAPAQQQQEGGRSVRFASTCEHLICFPKNTESEHRRAWYSQAELQSFKHDSAKTVQIIMNRRINSRNNEQLCERGLETMSKAGSLQKNSRLRFARQIVLEEQEDQKQQGWIDEMRLAELYKESASKCVASAIARGKFDANAAQQ